MTFQSPERYPVLLDSAALGTLGRWSLLAAQPRACLWADRGGRVSGSGMQPSGSSFLEALENWWLQENAGAAPVSAAIVAEVTAEALDLPFLGGWLLFLGYETACEVEPRLQLPEASLPWRAFALRTTCVLLHDHANGRSYIAAEKGAEELAARMEADARRSALAVARQPRASVPAAGVLVDSLQEESPAAYLQRVLRAKEYVRRGEIYQANLSRPWHLQLSAAARLEALYERLRLANPAPFAAVAQWGGAAILSSSPERLVRISGRRIETRPIAGTRPRSRRPGDDLTEMRELAAHPKERAEHIMLIDLERNDLGRVCAAGSVRVDEMMSIESYAHVHHIVSNVCGELRPDVTPVGALRAVFPGGTITGCPKFRCMQIIAELEGAGRGAYTGSIGYLGHDGRLDLNILIRTMTAIGRQIELRAGGGIVADSDPLRELEETRAKARGMLAAFELAGPCSARRA